VYSSHCLEHLVDPVHVIQEITRISEDGPRVEFWLPHGWNNDAFTGGQLNSPVPAQNEVLGVTPPRFYAHGRHAAPEPLEERNIERFMRWRKRLRSAFG
jgi:hypothetical protein